MGFSGRRTQIWALGDETLGNGRLVQGEGQEEELHTTIRPCASSLWMGEGTGDADAGRVEVEEARGCAVTGHWH